MALRLGSGCCGTAASTSRRCCGGVALRRGSGCCCGITAEAQRSGAGLGAAAASLRSRSAPALVWVLRRRHCGCDDAPARVWVLRHSGVGFAALLRRHSAPARVWVLRRGCGCDGTPAREWVLRHHGVCFAVLLRRRRAPARVWVLRLRGAAAEALSRCCGGPAALLTNFKNSTMRLDDLVLCQIYKKNNNQDGLSSSFSTTEDILVPENTSPKPLSEFSIYEVFLDDYSALLDDPPSGMKGKVNGCAGSRSVAN